MIIGDYPKINNPFFKKVKLCLVIEVKSPSQKLMTTSSSQYDRKRARVNM